MIINLRQATLFYEEAEREISSVAMSIIGYVKHCTKVLQVKTWTREQRKKCREATAEKRDGAKLPSGIPGNKAKSIGMQRQKCWKAQDCQAESQC